MTSKHRYYMDSSWVITPHTRYEKRCVLNVREPFQTALAWNRRYYDSDTDRFDSNRIKSFNSICLAQLIEYEGEFELSGSYGNYERHHILVPNKRPTLKTSERRKLRDTLDEQEAEELKEKERHRAAWHAACQKREADERALRISQEKTTDWVYLGGPNHGQQVYDEDGIQNHSYNYSSGFSMERRR